MYQIGEKVIYAGHGVCQIQCVEDRVIDRKTVSYYVLCPMDQGKTQFYVPIHNQVAMSKLRYLHSLPQIQAILEDPSIKEDCWIPEENRRKLRYKELTNSGDFLAIAQMIHTLQLHRQAQLQAGKKFHQCDENFLRDARRILDSEISEVMQIPVAQVSVEVEKFLGNTQE